jgi:hypothetical protein
LAIADDCSVIQDILTQNNLEITWSPSNSTGCCSYEGISCVNNRIIQVNFSSKGYTGSIESLMSLTSLQYININNCRFSGKIPSSVQEISNLQFLYAQGNKISGTIPDELAISTLQFIDLSGNKLEGSIPSSFGQVINLQHINLSNNDLNGSIPRSFHSLKNIQVFRVSGNPQLSGEIPVLSNTLKDCDFGSTQLCISDSRTHCTKNIKSCDSINTDDENKTSDIQPTTVTTQQSSESNSSNSNNNGNSSLGPEDLSSHPNSKKRNIGKWIALGFIILLVVCIIILLFICCKRHNKNTVIIEKPVPSHSSDEIFKSDTEGIDISDPNASIQIHSLNKSQPQTQQQIIVPIDSELYDSQTSSFDNSSHESGKSLPSNTVFINQNDKHTFNSLNRSQVHLANVGMIGTPVDSMEQDLGDIIISNNGTSSKRLSNISGYPKSQNSTNLVRLNRYSIVNQNSQSTGSNKKRLTNVPSQTGIANDSPVFVSSSANSSPLLDSKRSKHSSIPYPVSPYGMKSSTINAYPRKSNDTKRKSSGDDSVINNHSTIHVMNSKKSIPYPIEKSQTTTAVTKSNNCSETNSYNSVHNSISILTKNNKNNKNRNSLPATSTHKPSLLTKFSSQNSMNASPLATNSVDNSYEIPLPSDPNEVIYSNGTKRTSINPSTISSSNITVNSLQDINNKISNESFKNRFNNLASLNNTNSKQINSTQEHLYNVSSTSSEDSHRKDLYNLNNASDSNLSFYNQSNISLKNTPDNLVNDPNIVYNSPLENNEFLTEEIYIDDGDYKHEKLDSISSNEDNKEYHKMVLENDINQGNELHDDQDNHNRNESFEEQQPPNYEELFSEMYSPYVDTTNDEAIRMQLEMRRIEERQIRMEYLQKQIDNPEISNAQRQKYINALDRLMLE